MAEDSTHEAPTPTKKKPPIQAAPRRAPYLLDHRTRSMGGCRVWWEATPERRAAQRALFAAAPEAWARRFELTHVLEGHDGCVNVVRWDDGGRLLVSGSDDRCVGVWTASGRLATKLPTVHAHNIFDACFAPRSDERVVTCAADGRVGLVSLREEAGAPPHLLWSAARDGGSSSSYASGGAIASKLSFASPHVFVVAFSDGAVRGFDVRLARRARQVAHVAVGVGATAVEFRPTSETQFAVGLDDPRLHLCDLRRVAARESASCCETFFVPADRGDVDDDDDDDSEASSSMGGACEDSSCDDSSASSSSDDDDDEASSASSGASSSSSRRRSESSRSDDESSRRRRRRPQHNETPATTEFAGALEFLEPPAPVARRRTATGISGVAWKDSHTIAANFRGDDVYAFDLLGGGGDRRRAPVVRYAGRRNVQTCAKEVRWVLDGSALATGGDDGALYVWRASDGAPLARFRADRNVVNSIAPHPARPTALATAGVDSEVKLWDATSGPLGVRKSGASSCARVPRRGRRPRGLLDVSDEYHVAGRTPLRGRFFRDDERHLLVGAPPPPSGRDDDDDDDDLVFAEEMSADNALATPRRRNNRTPPPTAALVTPPILPPAALEETAASEEPSSSDDSGASDDEEDASSLPSPSPRRPFGADPRIEALDSPSDDDARGRRHHIASDDDDDDAGTLLIDDDDDDDDDLYAGGAWERRLAEKPRSVTSTEARERLRKAETLRRQGDAYVERGASSAAARCFDAALDASRGAPPSLRIAKQRRDLRNACAVARARIHLDAREPRAALRLLDGTVHRCGGGGPPGRRSTATSATTPNAISTTTTPTGEAAAAAAPGRRRRRRRRSDGGPPSSFRGGILPLARKYRALARRDLGDLELAAQDAVLAMRPDDPDLAPLLLEVSAGGRRQQEEEPPPPGVTLTTTVLRNGR